MSIFDFDIKKHYGRTTWPSLRKPRIMALADVMLHPLRQLQSDFQAFRDAKRIELSYTGQTILLEKYLNDRFDPELARIMVIHEDQNQAYTYFESEGQQVTYTYFESEQPAMTFTYFEGEKGTAFPEDFKVSIPSDLIPIQEQIRQAVKKYKIAGVTYSVIA